MDTLTVETVPKLLQKCWGQMSSSNAAGLFFFSVTVGDLGYLDLVAECSFKFMEYVTKARFPPKGSSPISKLLERFSHDGVLSKLLHRE